MTTISVDIRVKDTDAATLSALKALSTDSDFLSEAVLKVVELMQTSYTVREGNVDRMRTLRQKAAPYREDSSFASEEDFLYGPA